MLSIMMMGKLLELLDHRGMELLLHLDLLLMMLPMMLSMMLPVMVVPRYPFFLKSHTYTQFTQLIE